MTDFLKVSDLGRAGLAEVLEAAARVKADPAAVAGTLTDTTVGLFFEKPSLRTRVSCEVACRQLGADPTVLRQDEVGLGRREAVEDVGRVLDRYLDVLAFRVNRHADLVTLAGNASAPVINLLSDLEHPCQALADLQTLAEARSLAGSTVAFVGDGNNVCHSLMVGGAMLGVSVRVATPPGHEPAVDIAEEARRLAAEGAEIAIGNDPAVAVKGADAVYTDVWVSMGQETEAEERRSAFEAFRIDGEMFARASDDAVFLHCLPAHRGEEVTDEVMDHPRSRVYDQAENRLHAFKALLMHLVG